MPDRSYIIDIILRARDETAAAFARATGQMEAYDRLLEEQRVKSEAAKAAQKDYVKEVENRTKSEDRLNKELQKSKLRNADAVKALRDYEQAQRKVNQAESEGNRTNRMAALSDATKAHERLIKALQKETEGYKTLNKGSATAMSNRLTHQADLQAKLEQTAQIEQRESKKRIAEEQSRQREARKTAHEREQSEREWQRAADAINRETERSRSESMKRLAQMDAKDARDRVARRRQEASEIAAAQRANEQREHTLREYDQRVKQVAGSERRMTTARAPAGTPSEQRAIIRESLELDTKKARAKLDELRASERGRAVDLHVRVPDHDIALARAKMDAVYSGGGGRGSGGGKGTVSLGDDAEGGAISSLGALKEEMANLDTSTAGFNAHFKSAFGFGIVALIQPIAALLVGLLGTMGALASAAIAAGSAIATTFVSGIAQGIPVVGLFAAAMQRLHGIMSYVSTMAQQVQQRFIAQYQTAQQNAMGINQIVIAQHEYSDALFAQQQAVRNVSVAEHSRSDALYSLQQSIYNVRVAELGLSTTRQQAKRQLQDLIFQEEQAKLAAEASSLAVTDAQKNLKRAIETGGDVQAAQLQLAQAHAGHQQAAAQAQRSISDASRGSIARQNIQQTVTQAERGVTQARRAVIDAQFAFQQAEIGIVQAQRAVIDAQFQVAQARAAIIQARQAATGYNIATAAQLAYLRSQMTQTEKSLANNILQIYRMFQGVHGRLRPVTDGILGAFVPLTAHIIKVFNDPRIMGALLNLGRSMGGALTRIFNTIFSSRSLTNFISIINAAASNLRPLGTAISNIFRGVQAIVVTSLPFVHQFAGFIAGLTGQFARWAESTKGKNWLKAFFDVAFRSLESFIGLGLSVVRLFAAIIGPGGGAQAGIRIIQTFTDHINRLADSINRKGSPAWRTLHALWAASLPALHAFGEIMGAILHGLVQIGTSAQGQRSLKGFADVVAHILVPAFVRFIQNMGKVTSAITGFLSKHPALQKFLVDLIAAVATISVGGRAVGLIFGPLSKVIGIVKTLAELLPTIDLAAIFSQPEIAIVAGIAAAFVGLAAATGNLHHLISTLESPFKMLWSDIKPEIRDLGNAFKNFVNSILRPFGIHFKTTFQALHGVVSVFITGFGFLFRGLVLMMTTPLRIGLRVWELIFKQLANVVHTFVKIFHGIMDILHGHVLRGFKEIGGGILSGIWNGVKNIGQFFINIFKDAVHAVLHFLGISSASKLFITIGKAVLSGFLNPLGSLVHLGKWMLGWIVPGLKIVGEFFLGLGKTIIGAIVKGIKHAPHAIVHAITSLIPGPVRSIAKHIPLIGGLFSQHGGPVPGGYGGGDIVPAMVEPGEHILTKEEVQTAGGHGAIYAFRRSLGGGGQGRDNRFQHGGAVTSKSTSGWNLFDLGTQGQHGKTTQGVTGMLGSILANLLEFTKHATDDWKSFWTNFNKLTGTQFNIQQNEWVDSFKYIQQKMSDFFGGINKTAKGQLNALNNTFKSAFSSFDSDSFNAFWYIMHAAQQALQAFGSSLPKVNLAKPPKFAGGGFIGQAGERGRDAVHTLLGRGEAVLNWGHQRMVEPALRAYYGYGLNRMFQRTRGEHAGGGRGYAQGGYVSPFPKGTPVNWEREDAGQDLTVPPGTPVLAIASGTITGIDPNWYKGQPLIEQSIVGGPMAGRYLYYAEGLTSRVARGQKVKAGQVIGITTSQPTGLEFGFGSGNTNTLRAAVAGSGDSAGPWSATYAAFLRSLIAGHAITVKGIPGAFAAGAGAVWNNIQELAVRGHGALAKTLRAAIKKVTSAANDFGQKQAGAAGGAGVPGAFTGTLSGPVPRQVSQFFKHYGFNRIAIAGMLGNAMQESSMDPNAPGGGLWQQISNFGQGTGGSLRNQMQRMLPQIIGLKAALNNAGSPANAAAIFMNQFERPAAWAANLPHRQQAAQQAYAQGFARGGVVGDAIPIVAHVGEWVLNKMQQSRIAHHMGTTVEGLKRFLGFTTDRRSHYQGGGEVLPTVTRTGAFQTTNVTPLDLPGSLPSFQLREITIYNQATRLIISKIERNRKNIATGIKQFLSNFNQVGGDNGLFALAAQAIDQYVTQQTTVIQLAAAGVKIVNNILKFGRAQTELQAAQADLHATESETKQYEKLRGDTVRSLHDTNNQITKLLKQSHGHMTAAQRSTYVQLIGARNQLIQDINDDTQKIAQGISDQFTKAQAVFQARIDQALRPSQLAQGFAQMAQSVAQTFGRQGALGQADTALTNAAQDQVNQLQALYRDISAKAARDPRWIKMADDVAGQLESAVAALAQAQAQALADAMGAQDIKVQLQQAFVSMQQTILQSIQQMSSAFGLPGGQFAAISGQIGLSQQNAAAIQGQIQQYQQLYAQAQAQGNEGAMNQLTQTIDQLNATMAQANLQTQQLITSYYQLSATLQQSFAQQSTGLSSAATAIFQTLGQITGSLNLPQLIQVAQAAANSIRQAGQQALDNLNQVVQGGQGQAFGAASGTANQWLQQAAAAFQQGPTGFAAWLAQNAAGLAQFQTGLPSDEQTLFNNLLQALTDNTTAQVDNTLQLQQLNATTNQQAFTSSAWSMFREAIFTGMGGLLPQYALTVPSMDTGGFLASSGLLYGHKGETIIPAGINRGAPVGDRHIESHLHVTSPTEVADPVYLSNRVAWTLSHDPNSR